MPVVSQEEFLRIKNIPVSPKEKPTEPLGPPRIISQEEFNRMKSEGASESIPNYQPEPGPLPAPSPEVQGAPGDPYAQSDTDTQPVLKLTQKLGLYNPENKRTVTDIGIEAKKAYTGAQEAFRSAVIPDYVTPERVNAFLGESGMSRAAEAAMRRPVPQNHWAIAEAARQGAAGVMNLPATLSPLVTGWVVDPKETELYQRGVKTQEAIAARQQQGAMVDQADGRGFVHDTIEGAGRSVVQNLPWMVTPGGPAMRVAGMVAGAGAIQYADARQRAKSLNISPEDAERFVVADTMAETVPAAVMSAIGAPGMEGALANFLKKPMQDSIKKASRSAIKEGMKVLGKSTAEEVPEELVTSVLQTLNAKAVDPENAPQSWQDWAVIMRDTTAQTILAATAATSPNAARYAQAVHGRNLNEKGDLLAIQRDKDWQKNLTDLGAKIDEDTITHNGKSVKGWTVKMDGKALFVTQQDTFHIPSTPEAKANFLNSVVQEQAPEKSAGARAALESSDPQAIEAAYQAYIAENPSPAGQGNALTFQQQTAVVLSNGETMPLDGMIYLADPENGTRFPHELQHMAIRTVAKPNEYAAFKRLGMEQGENGKVTFNEELAVRRWETWRRAYQAKRLGVEQYGNVLDKVLFRLGDRIERFTAAVTGRKRFEDLIAELSGARMYSQNASLTPEERAARMQDLRSGSPQVSPAAPAQAAPTAEPAVPSTGPMTEPEPASDMPKYTDRGHRIIYFPPLVTDVPPPAPAAAIQSAAQSMDRLDQPPAQGTQGTDAILRGERPSDQQVQPQEELPIESESAPAPAWNDYKNMTRQQVVAQAKERGIPVNKKTPDLIAELESMNERGIGGYEKIDFGNNGDTTDRPIKFVTDNGGIKIPDRNGGIKLEDFGPMHGRFPKGSPPGLWRKNGLPWDTLLDELTTIYPEMFRRDMEPSEFLSALTSYDPKNATREYSLDEYLGTNQPEYQQPDIAEEDDTSSLFSTLDAERDMLLEMSGGDVNKAWQTYERMVMKAAQRGEPVDPRKTDAMRRSLLGDQNQADMFGNDQKPTARREFKPPAERSVQQSLEGLNDGMLFSTQEPLRSYAEQIVFGASQFPSRQIKQYPKVEMLSDQDANELKRLREIRADRTFPDAAKYKIPGLQELGDKSAGITPEERRRIDRQNAKYSSPGLVEYQQSRQKNAIAEVPETRRMLGAFPKNGTPLEQARWNFNKASLEAGDVRDAHTAFMAKYGSFNESRQKYEGSAHDQMNQKLKAAVDKQEAAWDVYEKELENAGRFGPGDMRYSIAHHGTPHTLAPEKGFPNGRFRLDKIGTGEGAQMYGHGIYFADSEDVSKSYAPRDHAFEDKVMRLYKAYESRNDYVSLDMAERALMHDTMSTIESYARENYQGADLKKALSTINEIAKIPVKGSVYRLDIPDNAIPKLLDWDKPLSEQSEYVKGLIRDALDGITNRETDYHESSRLSRELTYENWENKTGEEIYNEIAKMLGRQDGLTDTYSPRPWNVYTKAASEYLASIGIPGNKYLDGISRANGEGTHNYVIWDQGVLDRVALLERNGKSLQEMASESQRFDKTEGDDAGLQFSVAEDHEKHFEEAQSRLSDTNWGRSSVRGNVFRKELEAALNGKTDGFSALSDGIVEYIKTFGKEGLWKYAKVKGFVGSASKPVYGVNSSLTNCNPSKSCAKYCYACKGNLTTPAPLQKAEITDVLVASDPARVGKEIAREYKATPGFDAKKALRLFVVGDMSPQWVEVIKTLNEEGVRAHIFSKRPELLSKTSKKNVRLLSIDSSNYELAEGNNLPIAFAYAGTDDEATWIKEHIDRIQVILPIRNAGVANKNLDLLPSEAKKFLCPIDSGTKTIDNWNCHKCDSKTGIGCYHGQVTANNDILKSESDIIATLNKVKRDVNNGRTLSARERRIALRALAEITEAIQVSGSRTSGNVNGTESGRGTDANTSGTEGSEGEVKLFSIVDEAGVKPSPSHVYTRDGKSTIPQVPKNVKSGTVSQDISSKETSLNQIPSTFRRVRWQPGTRNFDLGAGRSSMFTDALKDKGVTNIPYDPFWKDASENKRLVEDALSNPADTTTANNVLNVIKEPEARKETIRQAARVIKPNGAAYFLIYEGDSSGVGKQTSKGWQNNLKANSYVAEVEQHFDTVERKGNLLVAKDPKNTDGSWSPVEGGMQFSIADEAGVPDGASPKVLEAARKEWLEKGTGSRWFKRWFGDSKVVDENGKPLVVYHGRWSENPFYEFATGEANGIFLSSREKTAKLFGSQREGGGYDPEYIDHQRQPVVVNIKRKDGTEDTILMPFSDAESSELAIDWRMDEDEISELDSNGLLEQYVGNLEDIEYIEAHMRPYDKKIEDEFGVMPLYLKMENPLVIEYGGKTWSPDAKIYNKIEGAQKKGYDGVVLKNIREGGIASEDTEITDTYIAFSPTQIKSATGNRGTFDPNSPDIRYSTANEVVDENNPRKVTPTGDLPSKEMMRAVRDELKGKKTQARNALFRGRVNFGDSPQNKEYLKDIDRQRSEQGLPEVVPRSETIAEAEDMLRSDREGTIQRILERGRNAQTMDAAETVAASILFNEMANEAISTGDLAKHKAAQEFGFAVRDSRAAWGRAGVEMQRPKTQAERKNVLIQYIMSPSYKVEKQMENAQKRMYDKKSSAAKKAAAGKYLEVLRGKHAQQAAKRIEWLKKLGYDISTEGLDAIMANETKMESLLADVSTDRSSIWDKQHEFRVSMMLTRPRTHMRNVLDANVYFWVDNAIQRPIEMLVNTFAGNEDAAQWGEIRYVMGQALKAAPFMPGFQQAVRNAFRAARSENNQLQKQVFGTNSMSARWFDDYRGPAIKGTKGKFLRGSLKGLRFEDELFTNLFGQVAVGAHAYRQAKASGLTGKALDTEVRRLIADHESDAWKAAFSDAKRYLLQDTSETGVEERLMQARGIPGGRHVVPFAATPMASLRTALRKAGGAWPALMYDIMTGQSGDQRIRHLSEGIMSVAVMSAMYLMLTGGDDDKPWLTGANPVNGGRNKYTTQSYEIPKNSYLTDDGTYKTYSSMGTFGTILSTIMTGIETFRKAKDSGEYLKEASAGLSAFGEAFVSQSSMLQGISDLIESIRDDKQRTRFFQGYAASYVPAVVKGIMSSMDDTVRDRRNMTTAEGFKYAALPQGDDIPPKVDIWGQVQMKSGNPVSREFSILNEVKRENTGFEVKLDGLIRRWNARHPDEKFGRQGPSNSFTVGGTEYTLTTQEHSDYRIKSGRYAIEFLANQKLNFNSPTQADINIIEKMLDLGQRRAKMEIVAKKQKK